MRVRLDKWLQVARLFKTRSQAHRACALGRVAVNGTAAKPHRGVAVEDRIEIERRGWTQIVEVVELRDRPVARALARELYRDVSPPRPAADPLERLARSTAAARDPGSGRPTKRDRRRLDRWRRD